MDSKSNPSEKVVFAPLGKLMVYVDETYHKALLINKEPLIWYRAKDQMTRGKWNKLMMEGYSLGEAMGKVRHDVKDDWKDTRGHGDTRAGDWEGAQASHGAWGQPKGASPVGPALVPR